MAVHGQGHRRERERQRLLVEWIVEREEAKGSVRLRLLPSSFLIEPISLVMDSSTTSLQNHRAASNQPQQLVVLAGVVGSGKSTFSQALCRQLPVRCSPHACQGLL